MFNVILDPTSASAAVTLKNPAMAVMVPFLGAEKAKLVSPTVLIVEPKIDTEVAELPNPITPKVPAKPPAMVVTATGEPEAKGMIAEAPVAPSAPVGPVAPSAPVGPVAPSAPVGPVFYAQHYI